MKHLWFPLDIILDKIIRKAAGLAVKPAAALGLTPNQVTLLGFFLFALPGVFCFTKGTYLFNIIGLAFLLVHTYFDHLDGMLAQFTGKTSKVGGWLDSHCDITSANLLIAATGYATLRSQSSPFWWMIVIIALFGQLGIYSVVWEYHFTVYQSSEFRDKFRRSSKITYLDKIIKDFIVLESPLFLILGTLHYSFFFAAILNQLKYFLLMAAVFYNLRWMVMFWAYVKSFDKKPRLKVLKILSKFTAQA